MVDVSTTMGAAVGAGPPSAWVPAPPPESAHPLPTSASASSAHVRQVHDICCTVLVRLGFITRSRTVGLQRQLPQTDQVETRFDGVEMAQVGRRKGVDSDDAGLGSPDRQLVDAEHGGERGRLGERAHAGPAGQRSGDRVS